MSGGTDEMILFDDGKDVFLVDFRFLLFGFLASIVSVQRIL